MADRCECEAEHAESSGCEREQEATCPLCQLKVCLHCMEGDEGQPLCTVCWDDLHVDELPECMASGHSHRATYLVAISTSSPVVRIRVCPLEWAVYEAQGYQGARFVRVHGGAGDGAA